MKTVFKKVILKGTRRTKITSIKWKVERKTFYQTINPFNRNPDGSIKTEQDIMKELIIERDNWQHFKV